MELRGESFWDQIGMTYSKYVNVFAKLFGCLGGEPKPTITGTKPQ